MIVPIVLVDCHGRETMDVVQWNSAELLCSASKESGRSVKICDGVSCVGSMLCRKVLCMGIVSDEPAGVAEANEGNVGAGNGWAFFSYYLIVGARLSSYSHKRRKSG